jgi:hypothetical protein
LSFSEISELEKLIYFSLIFISGEISLFAIINQLDSFFKTFKSGIIYSKTLFFDIQDPGLAFCLLIILSTSKISS